MGRAVEARVVAAAGPPEAAAAEEQHQTTTTTALARDGGSTTAATTTTTTKDRGGPPDAGKGKLPEDARLAKRRSRLDAACAAVFRTKLLRQFAALSYKNRESKRRGTTDDAGRRRALSLSATRALETEAAPRFAATPGARALSHVIQNTTRLTTTNNPTPTNNPTTTKQPVLVAWRSRRATTIRLVAPFVFLLLALLVRLSLEANSREVSRQRATPTVTAVAIRSIPACTDDLYYLERPGRVACVAFVYSPSGDAVVDVSF